MFELFRLYDRDHVLWGVIVGIGPVDEIGGRYPGLVEGHVVAAPVKGEGGGDTIDFGSGLELGSHGPLAVHAQ